MSVIEVVSGRARLKATVSGEGAPLVFLHAGVTDRRSWEPVLPLLSPLYRTVAYDRRGFGESVWEPESYSHVADLLAVLDACVGEQDPAVLVGNSQGGRIAIDFALAHPDRVRGLVLIGTAVTGAPPPEVFPPAVCALLDRIAAADAAGNMEEVNRLEAHTWLDGATSPEHRIAGPARDLFLQMNLRSLTAPPTGEEIEPPDGYARLHDISVPALLLVGALDFQHIMERSEILEEVMPKARLVRLADSAHLPSLDQPELLVQEVQQFMAKLGSGPADQ